MNGQVVPVSGGSLDGTSERAERKVKGEEKRGGWGVYIHRRVATMGAP